jgi:hypothetical protein
MIRTINFLCVAVAGLMCLGLYHVAEAARIADANVAMTQRSITREQNSMVVLQAEWARLTQPGRVAALAARHLNLTDKPTVELSSLTSLPRRGDAPLVPPSDVRTAKAVVPEAPHSAPVPVAAAAVSVPQAIPSDDSISGVSDDADAAFVKTPVAPNTGA